MTPFAVPYWSVQFGQDSYTLKPIANIIYIIPFATRKIVAVYSIDEFKEQFSSWTLNLEAIRYFQ